MKTFEALRIWRANSTSGKIHFTLCILFMLSSLFFATHNMQIMMNWAGWKLTQEPGYEGRIRYHLTFLLSALRWIRNPFFSQWVRSYRKHKNAFLWQLSFVEFAFHIRNASFDSTLFHFIFYTELSSVFWRPSPTISYISQLSLKLHLCKYRFEPKSHKIHYSLQAIN